MLHTKILGVVSGVVASAVALVTSAAAPTSFWLGEHAVGAPTSTPATGAILLMDQGWDMIVNMVTGIFPVLLPVIATLVFIFMIWRFIMGKLRMRG